MNQICSGQLKARKTYDKIRWLYLKLIIVHNRTYFSGHFVCVLLSDCYCSTVNRVGCRWLWLIGRSTLVYIHMIECTVAGLALTWGGDVIRRRSVVGQRFCTHNRYTVYVRAYAPKRVTRLTDFPFRQRGPAISLRHTPRNTAW